MKPERIAAVTRRKALGLTFGAFAAFGAVFAPVGEARALETGAAEEFIRGVVADLRGLIETGDPGPEGAARFLNLLEEKASLEAVAKFVGGSNSSFRLQTNKIRKDNFLTRCHF